jgi:hypothetical protein
MGWFWHESLQMRSDIRGGKSKCAASSSRPDHVIALNENHSRRLLREYFDYYNAERVETSLQDAPVGRPVESRPSHRAKVIGLPRVGGLHHRYRWREAAWSTAWTAVNSSTGVADEYWEHTGDMGAASSTPSPRSRRFASYIELDANPSRFA